ncbi:MAG: NUDIX hydrolase [Candidatus Methanomethylophilaceae archaeon]|nr:NUDIX hydrolase [Candidatus Methanomethylophilaceae archaeon]
MENTDIDSYLDFVNEYKDYYAQSPKMRYILDRDSLIEHVSKYGNAIGIKSRSKFNIFVVDLVVDVDGRMMEYQRVIPAFKGGVVIVPVYNGRYLLLNQYRHMIGKDQLCFPRGFGEYGLDPEENARAEILQEAGCTDCEMTHLGHLYPDSGLTSNKVDVFRCEMHNMSEKIGHEGIYGYRLVTEDELRQLIMNGEIDDGFTLSAFTLDNAHR